MARPYHPNPLRHVLDPFSSAWLYGAHSLIFDLPVSYTCFDFAPHGTPMMGLVGHAGHCRAASTDVCANTPLARSILA
jgi:hypothetical protein